MLNMDQVIATQKAALETAYGTASQLFARGESLVNLNLTTAKSAMGAAAAHVHETLSAKDPASFLAVQTAALQPAGEQVMAYGREVVAIAQAAGADLAKAYEEQSSKAQEQAAAWFDTAAKNAPTGFEGMFSASKSMIDASQRFAGYAQDAASKAAGMFDTAVKQASATVTPIAKTAKRR
jgi:phasin family protein